MSDQQGRWVFVPAGHIAYVIPIDPLTAAHEVVELLDAGEDG